MTYKMNGLLLVALLTINVMYARQTEKSYHPAEYRFTR